MPITLSRKRRLKTSPEVTNVRQSKSHDTVDTQPLLDELKRLLADERNRAFQIGDMVNRLVDEYGMRVKHMAADIGVSRQRLGEYRQTAKAFPPKDRQEGVDFHFFTVAARSASKLGITPAEALKQIPGDDLESTRKATRYLAGKANVKANHEAAAKAGLLIARHGELINRCHHADFRTVLQRLSDGSVKLVFADPPYGDYARLRDGQPSTPSASHRTCDGLPDADARELTVDLLRLMLPKLAPGGCLILFRPGAGTDPTWLTTSIDDLGWTCHTALTWLKPKTKLGRGDEPYGISSERLLVLARAGDRLVNHDNSPRSDVLQFAPPRTTYATSADHHLFEKPLDLCRFLINKHTYEGELVVEPFGCTGPACCAAAELNRPWLYCETHVDSFALGSGRITTTTASAG